MRPPTASEVWFARLERACPIRKRWWNPEYRELVFRFGGLIEAVRGKLALAREGGWQPNPHRHDWEWAEREEQRIWDAIGELYGIGPKPPGPGIVSREREQLVVGEPDELRQGSN